MVKTEKERKRKEKKEKIKKKKGGGGGQPAQIQDKAVQAIRMFKYSTLICHHLRDCTERLTEY